MTTLRDARAKSDIEGFIAEREAEGVPDGDADRLNLAVRRLAETPKEARKASKPAAPGD